MADTYYYMWEFVTSMTIIILVVAYIINDRIKIRFQKKFEEPERQRKINWLNGITMTIVGFLALVGGAGWVLFVLTHKIYITEELAGFHDKVPGIIMALIGLIVLTAGIKKYLNPEPGQADGKK